MRRGSLILAAGFAALLVGLPVAYLLRSADGPTAVATSSDVQIGGPFELVDATGRSVTDQTFRGKWMLIFFGFTYCPDVCPTTLNEIAVALGRLGNKAERLQALFVTVDPERDTPNALADYTAAFDNRILGLTGTPEQIKAMAKVYYVYFNKVQQGDSYTMEHSSVIYLMGPDGKYAAHFGHRAGGELIGDKIAALLARS